ncbi:hypothetical protein NKG05_12085 [Oerskovia sp. M15]
MGYVEWNTVSLDDAHNAGWPYVHGPNAAYDEWNYETATPRGFFDPAALKNNSRWNTGLVDLPRHAPPRSTTATPRRPAARRARELRFRRRSGAHGRPVYHYDAENPPRPSSRRTGTRRRSSVSSRRTTWQPSRSTGRRTASRTSRTSRPTRS